jgi:hypothetical protein
VTNRAELSSAALRKLHGFTHEAFKALPEAMGVVIENTYDPLRTLPTSDEQVRRVTFGEWSMATYVVSDGLELVRIVHITGPDSSVSAGRPTRHLTAVVTATTAITTCREHTRTAPDFGDDVVIRVVALPCKRQVAGSIPAGSSVPAPGTTPRNPPMWGLSPPTAPHGLMCPAVSGQLLDD